MIHIQSVERHRGQASKVQVLESDAEKRKARIRVPVSVPTHVSDESLWKMLEEAFSSSYIRIKMLQGAFSVEYSVSANRANAIKPGFSIALNPNAKAPAIDIHVNREHRRISVIREQAFVDLQLTTVEADYINDVMVLDGTGSEVNRD